MRDRGPETLGAAAAALALGAALVLAAQAGPPRTASQADREFQALVGGLGGGSATDLSVCPAAFDPRSGGRCAAGLRPVPGGFAYCVHHSGPSLRR